LAEQTNLVRLASEQNAIVDWMSSLSNRGRGRVFSVDLAKVFVRTNGQPVGVIADLTDIAESNGEFMAHFEMVPFLPPNGRLFEIPLRLFLTCTEEQSEALRNAKPDILGMRFAVIAKVESVSRPADAGIRLEDEDTLDAKGTCVSFLRLELGVPK
jgi:hypothetical protein